MTSRLLALALLTFTVHANPPLHLTARDECKPCAPEGATGTNPPEIGSGLTSMYVDLLDSVKDIHFRKRETDSVIVRADSFCCVLDCVNVQGLNIPMCYDKFTTNYRFVDGSYGSLTTGEYNQDGSTVNLLNGTYKKAGGESGDIYSADPSAKPNTVTLSIPPQWTSAGVGSAIPATDLGSVVPVTTTSSVPTQTNAATTTQASVISSQTNAAASSSSTAAAWKTSADSSASFGMSILSALMYAIYDL